MNYLTVLLFGVFIGMMWAFMHPPQVIWTIAPDEHSVRFYTSDEALEIQRRIKKFDI